MNIVDSMALLIAREDLVAAMRAEYHRGVLNTHRTFEADRKETRAMNRLHSLQTRVYDRKAVIEDLLISKLPNSARLNALNTEFNNVINYYDEMINIHTDLLIFRSIHENETMADQYRQADFY